MTADVHEAVAALVGGPLGPKTVLDAPIGKLTTYRVGGTATALVTLDGGGDLVRGGGAEPQLLNVPAAVLANLCVAYIMTSQNEAAEELMRKIEKEVGEHCRLLLL